MSGKKSATRISLFLFKISFLFVLCALAFHGKTAHAASFSISSVSVSNSSTTMTMTVTWHTSAPSSSQLDYGYTHLYGTTTDEADLSPGVTDHTVVVTGLSACRTYHLRAVSRVSTSDVATSSDQYFFSGACDRLFPDVSMHATCTYDPNAEITIRDAAQADSVRNSIISYIWNGAALPTRQPDSVSLDYGTLPSNLPATTSMPNLARIDRLNINMDSSFVSHDYLLVPTIQNNRLVILADGHVSNDSDYSFDHVIQYFIAHGYTVLLINMPGFVDNPFPSGIHSHDEFASLESGMLNPLKFFFEPIAIGLNYAQANASYQDVSFLGFSGGGWEATVYSAIDPRIKNTFEVAGSLPIPLRRAGCGKPASDLGDYEQGPTSNTMPATLFTSISAYPDLYILDGFGSGRKKVQILNEADTCCFAGPRFHYYDTTVSDLLGEFGGGGSFAAILDTHSASHMVSDWALANPIQSALQESVIISESGGSTAVTASARSSDSFTMALSGKPTADVRIDLLLSDPYGDLSLSPTSLTFTRTDWNVPQTVTLTAANSSSIPGAYDASVSAAASSADVQYAGIAIPTTAVHVSKGTAQTNQNISTSGSSSGGGAFSPAPAPVAPAEPVIVATAIPAIIPSPTAISAVTRDLYIDATAPEVRYVQAYLNSHGFKVAPIGAGSLGHETDYFGPLTQAALARFQKVHSIVPSIGYFGPLTRAYISSHK